MSELIEKKDAYNILKDMICFVRRDVLVDAYDTLKNLPTIDAVPVVHGAWIFNPVDGIEAMFTKPKCSLCGFESADALNYCPNCGARMDGGRTNNERSDQKD